MNTRLVFGGWAALASSALFGSPAASAAPVTSDALEPVLHCRSIADPAARLACFDRSVDDLQSASARRDIIVMDRDTVRRTRRSLFGFNLPNGPLFGSGDKHGERTPEEREISSTIRSAHRDADGGWVIVIDDGAVWHQTDGTIAVSPKPGVPVTIRRAALGSYFMRIGNQPGVKARRES